MWVFHVNFGGRRWAATAVTAEGSIFVRAAAEDCAVGAAAKDAGVVGGSAGGRVFAGASAAAASSFLIN